MKMVAAYLAGAATFLIASAAVTLAAETASVTISVPARALEAQVMISASPNGHDLQTQRINARVTDTRKGAGRLALVSTYATGAVVFGWFACTRGPCPFLMIPAGTEVSTEAGVHYRTASAANFPANGSSAPIPIQAVSPGPGGNTSAGTIVVIDGNKGSLTVTNPQPVTGGTNRQTRIVQQADFDAVRAALFSAITVKVADEMRTSARGMGFVVDGEPALTMKADHAVGDEAATFTITMTATLGAIAFSDARARSLIRSALQGRVPPGEELTSDPVRAEYLIQSADAGGDVTIAGTATGFVIPKLSTGGLRARIAGRSRSQARDELRRAVPAGVFDVRMSPFDMPWLPVLPARINLKVVARGT